MVAITGKSTKKSGSCHVARLTELNVIRSRVGASSSASFFGANKLVVLMTSRVADCAIAATAGLAVGLSITFFFRSRRDKLTDAEKELVAARAYIAAFTQRAACVKAESLANDDPEKAQTAAVDAAKLAKGAATDVEALAAAVRAEIRQAMSELAASAYMHKEPAQHGAPSAAAIAAMPNESKPPADNVSLASSSVATNGWVTPDEEFTEAAEVVSPPKPSATEEALPTGRRPSHETTHEREDLSEEAAYPVAAEQSLASSADSVKADESIDESPSVLAEADRLNEEEAHR